MRRSKSRRAARSIPVRGVTTVTGWLMRARIGRVAGLAAEVAVGDHADHLSRPPAPAGAGSRGAGAASTASAARVSGATVWTGLDIQLATGAAVMANLAMLS